MAADTVIDTDPVASAIIKWVERFPEDQPIWEGPAGDALAALNAIVGHSAQNKKGWPSSPRALTNRFRALVPVLSKFGIRASAVRKLDGRPQWRLWREATP